MEPGGIPLTQAHPEIPRYARNDRRPQRPRHIWLALDGPDIIELKQVVLDRDVEGAAAFFRRVVTPRVRAAAWQRGIPTEEADDRLPG